MTQEDKKLQRMKYLAEVIRKYSITEPVLSSKDIAIVLSEEISDISKFLKVYLKEQK